MAARFVVGPGILDLGQRVDGGMDVAQQRNFQHELGNLRKRNDGLWQAEATQGLPAVMGILHPYIVVPADFETRFDPQERELMLAHENLHIRAGDLYANAFAAGLRCAFWFNPLLHYGIGRFRHDQELACDARVIRRHWSSRRVYGQAMLKAQLAPAMLPVGCHWGITHPLKERILMLKHPTPTRMRLMLGAGAVAALTLGSGFVAWSAQPSNPMPPTANVGIAENTTHVLIKRFGHQSTPVWEGAVREGQPFSFDTVIDGISWHVEATISPADSQGKFAIVSKISKNGHAPRSERAMVTDGVAGLLPLEPVTGIRPPMPGNLPALEITASTGDSNQVRAELFGPTGVRVKSLKNGKFRANVLIENATVRQVVEALGQASNMPIQGADLLESQQKTVKLNFVDVDLNTVLLMLAGENGAGTTIVAADGAIVVSKS